MGKALSKSRRMFDGDQANQTLLQEDLSIEPTASSAIDPSQINISVSLRAAYEGIQLSGETAQEIPCSVCLSSKAPSDLEVSASADIVCVLDKSGSMNGNKMEVLKETLYFLIDELGANDRLGIVTFNEEAEFLSAFVSLKQENKAGLKNTVQSIVSDGRTNIIQGLKLGLQMLKERKIVNKVSSILILSDGLDNINPDPLQAARNLIREFSDYCPEGYSIHSFGYGSGHDDQLLTSIAHLKQGGFFYVETPKVVPDAFSNCIGEILTTVIDQITVQINPLPCENVPVSLTKVYNEEDDNIIRMCPVLLNNQKDGVFLLKVDPCSFPVPRDFVLTPVEAVVNYRRISSQQQVTQSYVLEIPVVHESNEVVVFKDVMISFYRAKGADIFKEAKKLANERKLDQARDLVNKGVSDLKNCIVAEDPGIKKVVKDMEDAVKSYLNDHMYEQGGRAYMSTIGVSHLYQRGTHLNFYQNAGQERFRSLAATRFRNS